MITPELSPDALTELHSALVVYADQGLGMEAGIKMLRPIAEQYGWDWLGLSSKREFNWRAGLLTRAFSSSAYSIMRLAQLNEANFSYWIYHADPDCCSDHADLNGLALPPDAVFWKRYMPPLGWVCGCYVVGARTEAGARRSGAEPGKEAPEWTHAVEAGSGLARGVEWPWRNGPPTLSDLLTAIARGDIPQPE